MLLDILIVTDKLIADLFTPPRDKQLSAFDRYVVQGGETITNQKLINHPARPVARRSEHLDVS